MTLKCWNLLKWKCVNCSSAYEFDGDNTPFIQGSALGALNGVEKWEEKVMELMDACDNWIPLPPRDIDKPLPDAG